MVYDSPSGTLQPQPSAVPAPELFPPVGRSGRLYPPESFPVDSTPAPAKAPSRATTVVVTALTGPFGLIPAYLHGREAERVGVPADRYWTAFALGLAAFVLIFAAGVGSLFGAVSTSGSSGPATSVVEAPAEAPAPPP